MRDAAHVTSLDALASFKAFFAEYGEQAAVALGSAESEAQRAALWVEEMGRQWQRELRKREHKMAEAKSELVRAELGPQRPDPVAGLVPRRRR